MIVINPETRLSIRHLDVLCRALNGYSYTKSNGDFVFKPLTSRPSKEFVFKPLTSSPNERFIFKSKQEALKALLALVNQQVILPPSVLKARTARSGKQCFVFKA